MKNAKNCFYIVRQNTKFLQNSNSLDLLIAEVKHDCHPPFSTALSAECEEKWPHRVRKLQYLAVQVWKQSLSMYFVKFNNSCEFPKGLIQYFAPACAARLGNLCYRPWTIKNLHLKHRSTKTGSTYRRQTIDISKNYLHRGLYFIFQMSETCLQFVILILQ